jgi:hypothetical protein
VNDRKSEQNQISNLFTWSHKNTEILNSYIGDSILKNVGHMKFTFWIVDKLEELPVLYLGYGCFPSSYQKYSS